MEHAVNRIRGPFVAPHRIHMFIPALKTVNTQTFWKTQFLVSRDISSAVTNNDLLGPCSMLSSYPIPGGHFSARRTDNAIGRVSTSMAIFERRYDIPSLISAIDCLSHLQRSVVKFEHAIDVSLWDCLMLNGNISEQIFTESRQEAVEEVTQAVEKAGARVGVVWSYSDEKVRKSVKWMRLPPNPHLGDNTEYHRIWKNGIIAASEPRENGVFFVGERKLTIKLPTEDPSHPHMHLHVAMNVGFAINLDVFAARVQRHSEEE